jgi:deoxyribose-phosphate aldolase
MQQRLEEIRMAVAAGAGEIDIVLSRDLVLGAKWKECY